MTTLLGGVGELYQGDLDLARIAVDRLASEDLGRDVLVEELYYGAIAVTQRLEDVRPEALVLVGACVRGREPGAVDRRRVRPGAPSPAELRVAVEEAGTGHVSIDLVLEVASGFDALPARTIVVDVEPATIEPSVELSAAARDGLERAVAQVRLDVGRIPLLELVDRIAGLVDTERLDPAPALDAMRRLVRELALLDEEGRWGAAFAIRDELRARIVEGATSETMDHLDWGSWWGLIEELDRLQAAEGAVV